MIRYELILSDESSVILYDHDGLPVLSALWHIDIGVNSGIRVKWIHIMG